MSSIVHSSTHNLLPFLFMGCWNRDAPPREEVAEHIRKNPIKRLILGGDNIYQKTMWILINSQR